MSRETMQIDPGSQHPFGQGVRFRFHGFPVHVEPGFLFVTLLTGSGRLSALPTFLVWAVVVFVSVLVHELGHAFAFRRFGHQPHISLHAMGGTTYGSDEVELPPLRALVVSLAGPAFGLVLGGLALLAQAHAHLEQPLLAMLLKDLVWANVAWGVLNLLPIRPLDGGLAFTSMLTLVSRQHALTVARAVSVLSVVALGVAAYHYDWRAIWFLLAWLGLSALQDAWQARAHATLNDAKVALQAGKHAEALRIARRVAARAPAETERREALEVTALALALDQRGDEARQVLAELSASGTSGSYREGLLLQLLGDHAEALPRLRAAFEREPSPGTGNSLARTLLELGKPEDAYRLMTEHPAVLSASLLSRLEHDLFRASRFTEALVVSQARVDRFHDALGAYNSACSLVKLGRTEEALAWLERAVGMGYANAAELTRDEDLAPLRDDPRFAALLARMS